MVRTRFTSEMTLPLDSGQVNKEAVGYTIPFNATGLPTIKTLAANALYWRITSVLVVMEPALSTSTQLCGLMNADNCVASAFHGFGNVFKKLRATHFSKRSSPGGNVQVKWPINMDWVDINDDMTIKVPQLMVAVTNPGIIESRLGDHEAWLEIEVNIQYIVSG